MTIGYPKPARRHVATGADLRALNDLVDARDQQRCIRCGEVIWEGGSRHHRRLRSRGGDDVASNLVLACGSGTTGCHGWMHANIVEATKLGYLVSSWADPRFVAIEHGVHGLVYLADDGTFTTTAPEGAVA
ncbi:hypothetical protein BKA24_001661 [Microbacterium marinum]|uniref:HNH endonuclease n=1 Tax=Microbacterium marinum TaxID=421115 RepID=A0A7W7FID6_9MICO|nr:hypothetical protein [Microbacterium marinum]MBB4666952.1 hypothetical protein [Microbacterium marinum]